MIRLPFSAAVLLVFISQVFGDLIQASVGDDVKFVLSDECMEGHGALNLHLKDGSIQVVASLHGDWEPGRAYTDRVTVSSDFLILTSVDLNDQGMYDFTCKKKGKLELTDLQVFLPSEVAVDEGEDAALPCRSITAGQRVKSAQWRRDGEVVLELNPSQVTDGNGFESRVSIPSDWFQRADLSLTIKRVQLRDRGVYFCDVDKAERHRSAVRLRVREIVPDSLTSTLKPTLIVSTLTLRVFYLFLHVTPKKTAWLVLFAPLLRLSDAHSDLISAGHTFTVKWFTADIKLHLSLIFTVHPQLHNKC